MNLNAAQRVYDVSRAAGLTNVIGLLLLLL